MAGRSPGRFLRGRTDHKTARGLQTNAGRQFQGSSRRHAGPATRASCPSPPATTGGEGRLTHRIPFGRLALEFVVIVVGVLVALGFDQWMTNIDHRRLVDETLYALAAEIAENTVTLERRMAYHDRILPGLSRISGPPKEASARAISISGALPEGLGLTPLRSTAWELAGVTEAVRHFDLPILSTLSLTYALQESLHEYDGIVSAGIIQPQFFADTDQPGPVIYLGVMLSDVREREDELGRFYAETLRHVRQRLEDPEAGAVMEVR